MHAPAHSGPPATPDPERWAEAGIEPSVTELLDDPLTALIMRRDGIGPANVLAAVECGRRALRERGEESEKGGDCPKAPVTQDGRPQARHSAPLVPAPMKWRPTFPHIGFKNIGRLRAGSL